MAKSELVQAHRSDRFSQPVAPRPRATQERGRARSRARSAAWTPRWRMAGGSLAELNYLTGREGQKLAALVEHALLDDLVCPRQHRWWDRQSERLGGLEVDHQIEPHRSLHRQLGWLSTTQDPTHILAATPKHIRQIPPVGDETPRVHVSPVEVHRRQSPLRRHASYLCPGSEGERVRQDYESCGVSLICRLEGALQVLGAFHL